VRQDHADDGGARAQAGQAFLVVAGFDGETGVRGNVSGRGELVGGGGLARLHQPPAGAGRFPAASTQGIRGDERSRQRAVAGGDSLDVGNGLGLGGDAKDVELAGLGGDELDVRVERIEIDAIQLEQLRCGDIHEALVPQTIIDPFTQ
jgi:hypothetical protein